MEEVPKIVGERLQAATKVEVHPDANLLAGFAEKSLTEREQTQILDHLAGCADCREVVALSVSELQAQVAFAGARAVAAPAPMPAHVASPAGLKWMRMRWAALAACVVVVGAVSLVLRHQRTTTEQAGSSAAAPSVEAAQDKRPESDLRLEARVEPAASPTMRLERQKSEPAKGSRDEIRRYDLPLNGRSLAKLERPAAPPPPPPTLPTVVAPGTVAGAAGELWKTPEAKVKKEDVLADKEADQANANALYTRGQNETVTVEASPVVPLAAPPAQVERAAKDAKAQPSTTAKSLPSELNAGYTAGDIGSFRARLQAPLVRWTLSPDGKLMRSFDQGKSWQAVPVATTTVLRALCVSGPEVWVGGARGVLYYSSDTGANWKQIKPTVAGQVLTADITGIEFPDPEHGSVTTADKQTWTTADGGESWQKK